MASVVVDTDVVSFLFKHDTHAEPYRPHLTEKLLVLSFMTIAELDRWVLERNWDRLAGPGWKNTCEISLSTRLIGRSA
jgi:hypothetical protein